MTARPTYLILVASLALAPALLAQDHAVPRGGGGGGSSGGGSHPSPGVSSSGSGSSSGSDYSGGSSSGTGSYSPSTAERRHPRAGTGHGSGSGGYYPYYPYYPYYWGGGYYPGYWGSWWPYGSFGWYGGYYGYPWGWGGGGAVYHYEQSESGSVRVLVDPSEARVYVDGYYAGTVDDFDGLFQRLHVSPGRHDIALKLEGYQTHRMRVYVAPDSTLKLHYDLQKGQGETFEDLAKDVRESEVSREREQEQRWTDDEARAQRDEEAAVGGRLKLSVRPDDASVYVDGAFRGSAREASSLKLAPGRHRIELVRPGYRTVEREVDVAPGEANDLSIEMEKPSV